MKQSELDRDVRQLCKLEAKKHGWKSVMGMPYWTIGPLFFVLLVSARLKEASFSYTLRFKWLELDRTLWRVLDLSSNEEEPFSLHANGAFVLAGQEILSVSERSLDWQAGMLQPRVTEAAANAERRAQDVSSRIAGLDSYLEFIRSEHEGFMKRYPKAVVNIQREELLAALLRNEFNRARQIALERIKAHDAGGFSSNGKSFYENALPFCRGDA